MKRETVGLIMLCVGLGVPVVAVIVWIPVAMIKAGHPVLGLVVVAWVLCMVIGGALIGSEADQ